MSRTVPALLSLLAAGSLGACAPRAEKAVLPAPGPAPARAVRVTRPATRIETGLARATGTVRAREEATLAARATGQILRVRAAVGDRVRAGAPLVEMDPANARIALQNARALERLAQASLAGADQDLARGQVLFEQQSMPEASMEKVRTARELAAAQLDQARAAVRAAQQQLSDATLVAPFDGVVTAKLRNAGDTVTLMPVTPILALTDVDHLEVRLALPEALEPFVTPGQSIEAVTTPGGRRFAARVRVKGAVIDPATRTLEVLADVARGDSAGLRPGSLVNVDLGGLASRDGLFVPTTALRGQGGKSWVFVAAGGRAEIRAVEVTPVNPGTVAVKSGLDAGADVILEPGALAAGDAVVPLAE
jgi:RND family efflux transporter MFP subunit